MYRQPHARRKYSRSGLTGARAVEVIARKIVGPADDLQQRITEEGWRVARLLPIDLLHIRLHRELAERPALIVLIGDLVARRHHERRVARCLRQGRDWHDSAGADHGNKE